MRQTCPQTDARAHTHTQNFAPASLWIYIYREKKSRSVKILRRPSLHGSSKHVSHPRVFASHRCFFFFLCHGFWKASHHVLFFSVYYPPPLPHLLILALSSYLNIPSHTKSGEKKERKEKKRVRVKRPEPSGHLKVAPRISGWQSGILQKRKEKKKKEEKVRK